MMMMKRPKGLGRGLDSLLGEERPATAPEGAPNSVPIARLRPSKYQPRTRMNAEALVELAESIKAQGVMQPILVRPVGADQYEIIAGERRFRAAQMAGLTEVPVLVKQVPDTAALAMALIENILREDLNPLEEAQGVQRLVREFDFTHEQAAATAVFSLAAGTSFGAGDPTTMLWFDRPAKSFHESLPLGNGRIGAMVFGGVNEERIVLNESSVWSGSRDNEADRPDAHKALPEIRRLLLEGNNVEAGRLVNANVTCQGEGSGHANGVSLPFGCYQTLGNLWLRFGGAQNGPDAPVCQQASRLVGEPGDRVLDRRQRGHEVVYHPRRPPGGVAVRCGHEGRDGTGVSIHVGGGRAGARSANVETRRLAGRPETWSDARRAHR